MYRNTELWESKLIYLKDLLHQYESLDDSWWDKEQQANVNNTIARLKKKIKDYEELIEYLREEK